MVGAAERRGQWARAGVTSILIVGFSVTLGACSEAEMSPVEDYCWTDCYRWANCWSVGMGSAEQCNNQCLMAPSLKGIRGDVLVGYARCLEGLSCSKFFDDEARTDCFVEAITATPPSEACTAYCEHDAPKASECGHEYDPEECTRLACGAIDATLQRATLCADLETCDEWETCSKEAFGTE